MYIRFVIQKNDEDSGRRQGIFQAVGDLEDDGVLLPHERTTYHELYRWFNKNLKTPQRFTTSSKPHAKKVAMSWFKDSVKEAISNMFMVAQILEAHGIALEIIRTDRPGYIVYEDQHQVTAEPFNDTIT